ncbi:MAG: RNA 3'-terminal phosphate cyclase [Acidobacteriota bacterium]|nr:RNA 3'-terminal phosphate cyclase [Acidobacteriota bacterium]
MIEIDGSAGEGGGQVLRSSLALSLITRKPFRIANIRAKRKSPGLLRQHLTAVEAATRIGDAAVEGAALGASELTFVPRALRGGEYAFAIGTAGSTMLVLQTILVPLLLADEPSTIELEGGTHNPASPPFDFLEQSYLPLLQRMGASVTIELQRPGFFPAGGGKVRVSIAPAKRLERLDLETRGEITGRRIRAVVANLSYAIAEREARTAAETLEWPEECAVAHTLRDSIGPGNTISICVTAENVTNVFTGFGKRGVPAEQVAQEAARAAKRYINSRAAADEHLADQLLLPMAAGDGGVFTTTPLSSHATTNIDVVKQFVDAAIEVETISNGVRRVTVR